MIWFLLGLPESLAYKIGGSDQAMRIAIIALNEQTLTDWILSVMKFEMVVDSK